MRPPACCLILVRFPGNFRQMKSDREERALAMAGSSEAPARNEPREPTVPVAYAEKTMSTLLRLHEELVEEKERRIDLYRRLLDREQELAELRAYVRLLEAELARREERPTGIEPVRREEAAPAIAAARPAEEAAPLSPPPTGEAAQSSDALSAPVLTWMPANLRRA